MLRLSQIRQPEYTGEHRCMPCTVVNIGIATVGSAFIYRVKSRLFATIVLIGSLGIIYLRGYLVPGTPQLTQQYVPDLVLQWFDKSPATLSTDDSVSIDPEQVLLNARAVTPCENGTDLCLTPAFQHDWHTRALNIEDPDMDELRDSLGTTSGQLSFEEYDDALIATADDRLVGQWNSVAAVVADVTAARVLAQRSPDWSRINPIERARVLTSLRIFIQQCPQCDGPVRVEQEVVESCCRSYDVIVSSCQNCGSQLFEIEWTDVAASEESDKQQYQPSPQDRS